MSTITKIETQCKCNIGCDPELFIETRPEKNQESQIEASEKIIPKEGIRILPGHPQYTIKRDGVQLEINPPATSCRASMWSYISSAFIAIKKQLDNTNYQVSSKAHITLPRTQLAELSKEAQTLGCDPSFNAYDAKNKFPVSKTTYNKRSCAGHLHFGMQIQPKRVIPLFDLLVGNTCVLIDKNPDQAERRKVYGKAGEYRLPAHGFEYRTLSNFWLRSYQLMSFVFGLARLALRVAGAKGYDVYPHPNVKPEDGIKEAYDWIMSKTDIKKIRHAINTNNQELARENFQIVEEFIKQWIPDAATNLSPNGVGWDPFSSHAQTFPLWPTMLPAFHHFTKQPLEFWFPEDMLTHWTKNHYPSHYKQNNPFATRYGWEGFMADIVIPHYMKTPEYRATIAK